MLAATLTILLLGPPAARIWRNYEEVFDLAPWKGGVLAATNGGLIFGHNGEWTPVDSPSGLRLIEGLRPVVVADAAGRTMALDGALRLGAPPTRARSLSDGMQMPADDPWLGGESFPSPPPAHPYSLIVAGKDLLAGTPSGLYRCHAGVWKREALPGDLPLTRPNGIAEVGGTFVVGGLGGLYIGRPGKWKSVCGDAIRQVTQRGSAVWIVHGNGALDKLEPATGRLYPDVLTGAAKRPWTSCVAANALGSMGGWCEWGLTLHENYPAILDGDVVTAIESRGSVRWIGTQSTGVVRFDGASTHVWNPGNGLLDTWVTSFCLTKAGLMVGTRHSGLFRIVSDNISAVQSPTMRITRLAQWRGRLVLGGMDGAWIADGQAWKPLPTHGEETTSISPLDHRLAITTASGVYFLP